MGDAADYLTDSMVDAKTAHDMGECGYGCQWCKTEAEQEEFRADREAVEAIPKAELREITIKVNKITLHNLSALGRVLKLGPGPIITKAIGEFARKTLRKKRR